MSRRKKRNLAEPEPAPRKDSLKKRFMHGFGMALVLASPLWVTITDPPNYVNLVIGLVLGVLLIVLASMTDSKSES